MPFSLSEAPVTFVRKIVIAMGLMTVAKPAQEPATTIQMPAQTHASPK